MFAMLFVYTVHAQTQPKEVIEETKTVTTKVNTGTEIKESTVEYNTRKEQDVKLAEGDKNKINQSRVDAPAQVTETVRVTDNSPFTANNKSMKYELDGKVCQFSMHENGFLISDSASTKPTKVEQSDADETQFVLNDNGKTGIGYFDEEGNFIVQQFDKKTNEIVSKVYTLIK
ncbi:conserved hypothetical protein [Formosa agariphila KMM 3901]|uniref:Uncharacterized protein n=2 Tax=Formosa TaxID=225842 RepID=T2KMI9_FORAG|nr:conserved hypothetical protein [Formosa agariphila KMM 3901]